LNSKTIKHDAAGFSACLTCRALITVRISNVAEMAFMHFISTVRHDLATDPRGFS